MTGMCAIRKSSSPVVRVIFCITFLVLVNAMIDDDVRPSGEPTECKCKFPKHHTPDNELLNDIRPLCGRR